MLVKPKSFAYLRPCLVSLSRHEGINIARSLPQLPCARRPATTCTFSKPMVFTGWRMLQSQQVRTAKPRLNCMAGRYRWVLPLVKALQEDRLSIRCVARSLIQEMGRPPSRPSASPSDVATVPQHLSALYACCLQLFPLVTFVLRAWLYRTVCPDRQVTSAEICVRVAGCDLLTTRCDNEWLSTSPTLCGPTSRSAGCHSQMCLWIGQFGLRGGGSRVDVAAYVTIQTTSNVIGPHLHCQPGQLA
jgi:hypothetical protein